MKRVSNLVSVIIPCYNHGEYIDDAIDSILSQTYQNFEIIVVDDGSQDEETLRILDQIDKAVTTVYHKENGGPASAKNYGIERSYWGYLLVLDSDDMFESTFLEKGLNILRNNPETGMVTSYVKRFNNRMSSFAKLEGGSVEDFLARNQANGSLLFRHQCWLDAGGYDEKCPGFEDWEFCINVAKQGWFIYSIPEYLFFHRELEGSVYDLDSEIRPDIIKYIVNKHKEVYQQHITEVIYSKEQRIKELKDLTDKLSNSKSLKIGSAVLKPFSFIKLFFK